MEAGTVARPMIEMRWQTAAREEAGFAAIVRAHQSMVYSIGWRFFRDRAVAEEVAQDVFLQLFRNLDSIESEKHLEAWLRRSASNRCIDLCRRRNIRGEVPLEGMPEPASGSVAPDLFQQEQLRRMVATLPEKLRMVIVLKYGEDLDAEEIAETLGLPVRTVWSHLRRGIEMLKQKAGHFLGDGKAGEQ